MTYNQLIADITFWTGASTSDYTTELRTANLNNHYHSTWSKILAAQDEWDADDANQTNYPVTTTDLVANQQDYTFPASLKILKIKRVEVNLDGTWRRVKPMDVNQLSIATDTATLDNHFNVGDPYYDVEGDALKLYPIPTSAVIGGLKIWYLREPIEFTTASDVTEPGFDEPFHRMLSIGASLDWAVAKNLPNAGSLQNLLSEFDGRIMSHYGSKQKDRDWTLQPNLPSYK